MRIIKESVLKDFYLTYPDSEKQLRVWITIIKKSNFNNANEIQEIYPGADHLGNKRIVFNICRNKYMLIVLFLYEKQRAYIRFIGTHKVYDQIFDIKNI